MAGVNWVAGTTTAFVASATSINATTPAGLADGDVLVAFVMARSALTPPAGWTLKASQACVATGTTQTIYLYQKTTVTSGDSSTVTTWSQASLGRMGVTFAAVRAGSGVGVVRATSTVGVNDTSTWTVTPTHLTANRDLEILLTGATIIAQNSPATPTPPTNFTRSSGGSMSDYRLAAAWREINAGSAGAGSWVMSTGATSNNGLATIMARITDLSEDVIFQEGVSIAEEQDLSGSTYGQVLGEALGFHDITGEFSEEVLADAIGALDTAIPVVATLAEAADTLSVRASQLLATRAYALTASDTVSVALAQVENMGVVMRETLGMTEPTVAGALTFRRVLADITRVADAVQAGEPVSLADALGLAVATQIAQAATVIQALGLAEVFNPTTTYNLTLTQQVALADALRRFLGANAADGLGLTAAWVEQAYATGVLADTVTLAASVDPRFILRATLSDGVDISAEQALSMIFAGVIEDGVELAAGYVSPAGSFTAWAMNARTGAVSEYTNFEFNSFARQGNTYLAASSTGLYELVGDDDAGTDIVARLKSGFLQFGGTHLSRLKAAYIATRGEGDFVLKIETGDGSSYSYAVTTRNMRSTKVHMGKGQRARYFSFELISAGQDFDLDTLEFVPITVQRRV